MMALTEICGWGRYPKQDARLLTPSTIASLESISKQENSFIEDDNVEIVDLPEDLVINLNNEQGGENGKK